MCEDYLIKKMALEKQSVYVVQFLTFKPYENIDKYVCVPSSWITSYKPRRGIVLVAYPVESPERTEERVRRGEDFSSEWNKFWAYPVAKRDHYNNAVLWIVANYNNERNDKSNTANDSQRKSVVSETDQSGTRLLEAIKRPGASDPRLERSVNLQKQSRFEPINVINQRSKSLGDSRAIIQSYNQIYSNQGGSQVAQAFSEQEEDNAQSSALQSTANNTTYNTQTTTKSPNESHYSSSSSSHQQLISVVSNNFLIGDCREQVSNVDRSNEDSNSTTTFNCLKQVSYAQTSHVERYPEYQPVHRSSKSTSTKCLTPVIERLYEPSTDLESSSNNKDCSGNRVPSIKEALSCRNSIEINTQREVHHKTSIVDEARSFTNQNDSTLVSQPENSVKDSNLNGIVLEILKEFNNQSQTIPNNTTSVQNSEASVSNCASQSNSTEYNTAMKSSVNNCTETDIQSHNVQTEFSSYSNQELIGNENDHSVCLENKQHNTTEMQSVLNKINTLQDRFEHVESLFFACISKNMRRTKNKRNRKRKISINSSGDNDDSSSSASAYENAIENQNYEDVKRDMELVGEYFEGQRKNFILPPEYTPNDSKWTLQHQIAIPGVVELRPHSGVLVDAIQLGNCLKEASNFKILAQMLLMEIFTPNALRVCSFINSNNRALRFRATNVRPELDQHARNELLEFVESYARYRRWNMVNKLAIKYALCCKIHELRSKHENNIESKFH